MRGYGSGCLEFRGSWRTVVGLRGYGHGCCTRATKLSHARVRLARIIMTTMYFVYQQFVLKFSPGEPVKFDDKYPGVATLNHPFVFLPSPWPSKSIRYNGI